MSRDKHYQRLSPNRYRLRKTRWYYKNRGRISWSIAYYYTKRNKQEVIEDVYIKTKVSAPKNWQKIYWQLVEERF